MEEGRTAANRLTIEDIGREVSYGPGMMFTGILADVRLVADQWWGGRVLQKMDTPLRVHIETTDGRAATVPHQSMVCLTAVLGGEKPG